MASKRIREPDFSTISTDELKSAYDPNWHIARAMEWQGEMLRRDEPLNSELLPYLESTTLGPFLRHALYNGLCDTKRAALVNFAVERKQEEIKRLISKKRWLEVVTLHEKAFLLKAFIEYLEEFNDKTYWQILGEIWVTEEQIWRNRKLYLRLFQAPRPQRQFLMTAAERRKLDGMPDEFPVYRGYIGKRGKGLSWTLDHSKAEWFARRYEILSELGLPRVMEGTVNKVDVIAYFNSRKEKEIVADPAKVRSVKTHRLQPNNDDGSE